MTCDLLLEVLRVGHLTDGINMNFNALSLRLIAFAFMLMLSLFQQAWSKPFDVEFVDLSGKTLKLSDFRGQWVVVNLWATWCPPCVVEMPELVFFHDKYKGKGAMVLGVNFERNAVEKIENFAQELMINFPIVRFKDIDLNKNSTPFGPLRGLPSTYMVAPNGEVVAGRAGIVDVKLLEAFIEKYEQQAAH
jgi:thiol-disulfide isomerase/thioredoxin